MLSQVHGVLSAELAALRKSTSDAEHTKQELQQELEACNAACAAVRADCARAVAEAAAGQEGRAVEKEEAAEELACARGALEGCKR